MSGNTNSRNDIVLIRSTPRCDNCGAYAQVRLLVNETNLPLFLCRRHYLESAAALAKTATITHDKLGMYDPEKISA